MKEQYSFNDGEYIDYSPYEVIQYMLDQDMLKEHIIGDKLSILRLEQCIDSKVIEKMQDTLYNRCEDRFDENDWLENKLSKIWKQFEELEMFYDCGEYYTITEEDYDDVVK